MTLRTRLGQVRRRLAGADGAAPDGELPFGLGQLTDEDRRYLATLYDDRVPLPPQALDELREDSPRLADLRARYEQVGPPVVQRSRWRGDAIQAFLDLRHFRGETLFVWHYRELPRIDALKYFVLARYVRDRDAGGLLERLDEDGAFGCWTFEYPGYGRYSRDLLESVNEICFLERAGRLEGDDVRVLDIGAGYGRLAHRMCGALGGRLSDYCCVDAVPESTFVSEFYLRFRGCSPPARVVALDEVDTALAPGGFDLALNIHSFSECPLAAIEWWVKRLERLRVPWLLVVPNEPRELLSLEPDGTRRDFAPLLAAAGYRPVKVEPVLDDPAVRELVRLEDHFHLFRADRSAP